jgi:hypothetical protein
MSEIPAIKTPRILAVVENLSTSSITYDWLLHFEPGGKVLTGCAHAESPVWRGFSRVRDVEKLRKALEKKTASAHGIRAGKRGLRQGCQGKIFSADEFAGRDGKSVPEYTALGMSLEHEPRLTEQDPPESHEGRGF